MYYNQRKLNLLLLLDETWVIYFIACILGLRHINEQVTKRVMMFTVYVREVILFLCFFLQYELL